MRGPDGVLAGSVLTMIEAVRNLHALGAPLEEAVARRHGDAGLGARRRRAVGRLDVGLPADLVVLDDRLEIVRVLVAGEVRVAA